MIKFFIASVTGLLTCICMNMAFAHDKVVVIPMGSVGKLNHVITVSVAGGDFTDPVAAVESITDASETNPYLVMIGPGVYVLTETLVMKQYVSISGSGQGTTILTGSINGGSRDVSSALISGASNASLSNLTLENIVDGSIAIAFYNNTSSPAIHNVTVTASASSTVPMSAPSSYGIYNNSSSPDMNNIDISCTGGDSATGIYNNSSSPTMANVTISASGGKASTGIHNIASAPIMNNIDVSSTSASVSAGITNESSSSPIMTNMNITSSGPLMAFDVSNDGNSTTEIRHSRATGGITVWNGTVRIIQSSILGGVGGGGTKICLSSDNGVDKELNTSCAEL